MNFLQLCQRTAAESGVYSGVVPTTVVGQTGGLLDLVNWVNAAWLDIQNRHAAWRWKRKEFSTEATSGTSRYTAAGWAITDFGEWITEDNTVTIYKTSLGVSDEREMVRLDWVDFRRIYGRGTQTANQPVHYAISPQNEFCLGPEPDASYRVRGEYRRDAQVLAANADTPECPVQHHLTIVWRALEMLNEYDVAEVVEIAAARRKASIAMFNLERDQLPELRIGSGPIA